MFAYNVVPEENDEDEMENKIMIKLKLQKKKVLKLSIKKLKSGKHIKRKKNIQQKMQ